MSEKALELKHQRYQQLMYLSGWASMFLGVFAYTVRTYTFPESSFLTASNVSLAAAIAWIGMNYNFYINLSKMNDIEEELSSGTTK